MSFTNRLKKLQMQQYGIPADQIHAYEEDHLIPLSLGGAPDDPANLWPQPFDGKWNAPLNYRIRRSRRGP